MSLAYSRIGLARIHAPFPFLSIFDAQKTKEKKENRREIPIFLVSRSAETRRISCMRLARILGTSSARDNFLLPVSSSSPHSSSSNLPISLCRASPKPPTRFRFNRCSVYHVLQWSPDLPGLLCARLLTGAEQIWQDGVLLVRGELLVSLRISMAWGRRLNGD